jgi:hypothetical protein
MIQVMLLPVISVLFIIINDLSANFNHFKFILFSDDLKIYRDIKSLEDCKALQADMDLVQQWCVKLHETLHAGKYLSHVRPTVSITVSL